MTISLFSCYKLRNEQIELLTNLKPTLTTELDTVLVKKAAVC